MATPTPGERRGFHRHADDIASINAETAANASASLAKPLARQSEAIDPQDTAQMIAVVAGAAPIDGHSVKASGSAASAASARSPALHPGNRMAKTSTDATTAMKGAKKQPTMPSTDRSCDPRTRLRMENAPITKGTVCHWAQGAVVPSCNHTDSANAPPSESAAVPGTTRRPSCA
jgi:hypothetical protein